jgi:transcription-repair coupling factor (superfamily II helicase)
VTSEADIDEVREELVDRYGELPEPVHNLLAVASFRVFARRFGVADVATQGKYVRFAPLELRESQALRLARLHPGSVVKAPSKLVLVTAPMTARVGGQQLRDRALLDWCREVLQSVVADLEVA